MKRKPGTVTRLTPRRRTPSSVNLDFQIRDLKASKIRPAVVKGPEPGYSRAIATNAVAEAQLHAKENPEYWLGDVDTVAKTDEFFVQQAVDEKIPGVAPPISVLVITTSGFDWRKKGPCVWLPIRCLQPRGSSCPAIR